MDQELVRQLINYGVIIIVILVILYFMQSSRKKQEQDVKKMQDEIKKGDKIVTYSGFSGVVEEILEDRVIILTNPDKVKVSIEKWAIAGIDDRNI